MSIPKDKPSYSSLGRKAPNQPYIYKIPEPRPEWLALYSENAIEPQLPIIDAHHHLWGEQEGYLLDDFVADITSGHRVVATIFVQCQWSYRTKGPKSLMPIGETERVRYIAEEAVRRKIPVDICAGIIGFADMGLGDLVEPVLQAHVEAGGGRFRGVRHSTTNDPGIVSHFFGPTVPDLLMRESFQRGLSKVQAAGLTFDAWIYFKQIPQLTIIARAFPDLKIVLNHLGAPLGVGPYQGRRKEVFQTWRATLKELSSCPNVYIKIGGLGMVLTGFDFHHQPMPPNSQNLAEHWTPYVHTAIELFGASRCMFESNFPVDKVMCDYTVLWNAFKHITAGASSQERHDLFGKTAATFYRLNLPNLN